MSGWWNDLFELFFPSLCVTCGKKLLSQEKYVCLDCRSDFPRTNFHRERENKVAQLFWGRVEVEQATSFLYFRKGSRYQRLVHFLKYKGLKELGPEIGNIFGQELLFSPFDDVEVVVPVPLHPKKLQQRGYNQSEWIARGIAAAMQKPLSAANLQRVRFTPTQTRKTRFERWQNVEGIFAVENPEEFAGKHLLLVDDVVTTGSTLEAAAFTLLQAGAARVSIATLACAEI